MEEAVIKIGVLLGLSTGFHCVGMCGPIALTLGLQAENKVKFISKNFTYQMGRVFTYTMLGLVLGIVGEGLKLTGYHQQISISLGVLMILMVLLPLGFKQGFVKFNFVAKLLQWVKMNLGKYLSRKNYSSLFVIGVLNGLLPCGAVYVALTAALATTSLIGSGLLMFSFGLGTLPFMFAIVYFGNFISINLRSKIAKISPIIIILVGSIFIVRGLGLEIPYLSPATDAIQLHPESDCCH